MPSNRTHQASRVIGALAALALVAAGMSLALPVAAATATTGAQLTATPSDNLGDQDAVQPALSGADDYDGQTVYFAECNTTAAPGGNYDNACNDISSIHAKTVSNGSATDTFYAVAGSAGNGSSCNATTNGQCVMAALSAGTGHYTAIATAPITFGTPAIHATPPTTNLDDGDSVQVTVTGVSAGTNLFIEECDTDAPSNYCEVLGSGTADVNGYTGSVKVVYGTLVGTARCDENTPAGHCVLEATQDNNGGPSFDVSTPISFEAPTINVSATPNSDLHDGESVTITGSGIPAEDAPDVVAECNTTYAADNGGYDASLSACGDYYAQPQTSSGAFSTTLSISDGPLHATAGGPACDYATNGDCAIVDLKRSDTAPYNYTVVQTPQPITFRPTVTGPAEASVSPTTNLRPKTTVTLHATDIPDGDTQVVVEECNTASVHAHGPNDNNCTLTLSESAVHATADDNTVTDSGTLPDGFIQPQETCDPLHACELGLFNETEVPDQGGYETVTALISNWVPVWYGGPAETSVPAAPSPTTSGPDRVGSTDSCTVSTTTQQTAAYAWYVGSTKVGSGPTLDVPGSAYGRQLRCAATLTNALGTSQPGDSNVIKIGRGPALHRHGSIFVEFGPDGPTVGHKVKAFNGVWTPKPTSYSYQWYRGTKKIKGATGSHYKLAAKDRGKLVRCRVTAHAHGYANGVAMTRAIRVS